MSQTPKQTVKSTSEESGAENKAPGWAGFYSSKEALSNFFKSPLQTFKSRLGWRITITFFLTVLIIQALALPFLIERYKQERLSDLREIGKSAITPLIHEQGLEDLSSPIDELSLRRLIATTRISGIEIYSPPSAGFKLLKSYGEPLSMKLTDHSNLSVGHLSKSGTFYETVLRQRELARPYIIAIRLDSEQIHSYIYNYIEQSIIVILLLSIFVTLVLTLTIRQWLLQPIIFLREILWRALENPESPKSLPSPYNPADEIGEAIEISLNLIELNAKNIKRIKSSAEDQIHKLAYYDTLTGLPNRTFFLQTLNEMAVSKNIEEEGGRFAVIALDLDHFKDINDTMGHNIGDAILRAVGKRLRASMPDSAVVARSGEDEFAITMILNDDAYNSRDIADRVASVIRAEPFKVFNENFQVRASIGVSTYPDDGHDPDQVLKNAAIALNRAKEEGRDTIKEYNEDFDRAVQLRFQMLRDLTDALAQNELHVFYQPQFELDTGRMMGAEALLRWWKPDNSKAGGSYISPVDFIPIAEQSGLITPIGEYVLREAVEITVAINQKRHDFCISVNISAHQFQHGDICNLVDTLIRENNLNPNWLELEVTESVFMEDVNRMILVMERLNSIGIALSIDDFGTGYSSLSYLRQFPIDRLKIDQSFIRNALNNADDAAIARTIVRLGHSLGLRVIAEGVETKEHETFLIQEGCDEVQGFRYSRPIPKDDFLEFLNNYKGDLSVFDKD